MPIEIVKIKKTVSMDCCVSPTTGGKYPKNSNTFPKLLTCLRVAIGYYSRKADKVPLNGLLGHQIYPL